jgi:hypothetical protein
MESREDCLREGLTPVVLALQPMHADAQGQPAPVQRVPTYAEQQER